MKLTENFAHVAGDECGDDSVFLAMQYVDTVMQIVTLQL